MALRNSAGFTSAIWLFLGLKTSPFTSSSTEGVEEVIIETLYQPDPQTHIELLDRYLFGHLSTEQLHALIDVLTNEKITDANALNSRDCLVGILEGRLGVLQPA